MRLLDINVLIARLDPSHTHHGKCATWFEKWRGEAWATCPITENGVIRILSHPGYPGGPASPERAVLLLRMLTRAVSGHSFLPDKISLLDRIAFPNLHKLASKQITDLYLLALALNSGARFVTFDGKVDPAWVPGGSDALEVLD